MEQKDDRPQWLLELENRKKKPHLAHETGAGAPCLTCKSACPGLDLHFWRKICKICKCRGDDHDVDNNEFPQFEILFGTSSKPKKRNHSILLRVNKDKENMKSEIPFEWIPPNINKDLAEDYMKALPTEKLPIKGSVGAAFRRKQLQKQIPLHDIDYKVCDDLSDLERNQFNKHLNNLKNCAGQGIVSKLMVMRPFDQALMTPANATDVQSLSPQHSHQIHTSPLPNLRIPSSFIKKPSTGSASFGNKITPTNLELIKIDQLNSTNEPISSAKYHHVLTKDKVNFEVVKSANSANAHNLFSIESSRINKLPYTIENLKIDQINNSPIDQNKKLSNEILAEKMLSEALLPPSAIHSSDIVGSSLDAKGLNYIREKLSDKYNLQSDSIGTNLLERPIHSKDDLHPSNSQSKRAQAEISTTLPINLNQIHSKDLNNTLLPENAKILTKKIQNVDNDNNIPKEFEQLNMESKSHFCHQCKEIIKFDDVVITADKMQDSYWHPGCFTCSICNELLVDLLYFCYKEKLYCGRDFASLLEVPRCFACDELIFVRSYTIAEGHNYHVKHFCCWDCDTPLAGQQYISEEERPLCLLCYQKSYAKICNTCNNVISVEQEGVHLKNLNFHSTDDCFSCFSCKKSLKNGKIGVKEDKPFCSKECISKYLKMKNDF